MKIKEYYSGIALLTAVGLAVGSFVVTDTITANLLIAVAQFLLYSLTLLGFGEFVMKILEIVRNARNQ